MYRRIIIFLVALALLAGAFALFPQEARAPHVPEGAATSTDSTAREASAAAAAHTAAPGARPVSPRPAAAASSTENAVLIIGTARYPFTATTGTTVESAMRQLAATAGLRFTSTDYPGLGIFIESIDGQSSSKTEGWFLYKNGVSSGTGASQTRVAPGDTIEWRFEKSH